MLPLTYPTTATLRAAFLACKKSPDNPLSFNSQFSLAERWGQSYLHPCILHGKRYRLKWQKKVIQTSRQALGYNLSPIIASFTVKCSHLLPWFFCLPRRQLQVLLRQPQPNSGDRAVIVIKEVVGDLTVLYDDLRPSFGVNPNTSGFRCGNVRSTACGRLQLWRSSS